MQKEISVSTGSKTELVDITEEVSSIVGQSGLEHGICHLFVPHATAGLTINENADPNVKDDILKMLSEAVPQGRWKHDKVDNNGAAHIKSSIIGPDLTMPVKDSELVLGTWQNILLCDFDGPRKRRIIITLTGGKE
ncbi:MAG: secondary thiamine-phosphate synthase enzyme YjbQ [Candidatus Woesearchaeota archaeon]